MSTLPALSAAPARERDWANQFLGHIRQVDAIAHVVRCFADSNIVHVDGDINPLRDREIINMELIPADMETVARRLDKTRSQAKSGDKLYKAQLVILEELQKLLDDGKPARLLETDPTGKALLKELCLLTAKPVLYVANVA